MKQIGTVSAIAILTVATSMTITNPTQEDYDQYARDQLAEYLKENVCNDVPEELGEFGKRQCRTLVDTGRIPIQQLVAANTERENYFLFSIYRTKFSDLPFLPTYYFETVGVLQQFVVYQAEEQR